MTRLEKVKEQAQMSIAKINDWVAAVEISEAADEAWNAAWKEPWRDLESIVSDIVKHKAILCEREEADSLVGQTVREVLAGVQQMRFM